MNGAEPGADATKTEYTSGPDTMAEAVEGCPVPVLTSGAIYADVYADGNALIRSSLYPLLSADAGLVCP